MLFIVTHSNDELTFGISLVRSTSLIKLSPLCNQFRPSPQIWALMAASLPQKPGMAGLPPQQQPHLPPSAASAPGQQPMPPQGALREISPVFLCRIGQETVQDIVTRTMEIFQITRATQVRLLLSPPPPIYMRDHTMS